MRKRRKRVDEEELEEEEEEGDETWSFKRILVAIIILTLSLGIAYYFAADKITEIKTSVLGISERRSNISNPKSSEVIINAKKEVESALDTIKKDISEITPEDVASSSPEIQKIINDLKSLQEKQKGPMDVICESVCKK